MKQLDVEFKKNGIKYVILSKTTTRYLAELRSLESDGVIGYETGRLIQGKEQDLVLNGSKVHFEAKEYLVGNESFGKDKFEISVGKHSYVKAETTFRDSVEFDKKKNLEKWE